MSGFLLMALPPGLLRWSWVADWETLAARMALPLAIVPAAVSLPLLVLWLGSRGRAGWCLPWLVTVPTAAFLWLQAAYQAEFRSVAGLGHLRGIGELPEVAGLAVRALLQPGPLLAFGCTLTGGWLLTRSAPPRLPRLGAIVAVALLLLVGSAAVQEFAARRWGVGGFARQVVYDPVDAVARHGFGRWWLLQLRRAATRLRHPLEADPPGGVATALGLQSTGDPGLLGSGRGLDLIVLQLESVDPELLDQRDDRGRWVMPYLRRARQEWAGSELFFAQHSAGGSSDAELATLLSLLPTATHGGLTGLAQERPASLAEIVSRAGYSTAFLHGNRGTYYGREAAHRQLGFEHRWFGDSFRGDARGFRSRDAPFYTQALEHLGDLPRPLFAYLVSMQCHEPWTNHQGSVRLVAPSGDRAGADLDDLASCQREADQAVELLVRGLERQGRLENTLLVVFGDHRSGVVWGTEVPMERVPLLIRLPTLDEAAAELRRRLRYRPMTHLDLAPTLSDLLGLQGDPRWLGLSALGETQGVAIDNRLNTGRCPSPPVADPPCESAGQLEFERQPALLPLMIYSAAVAGG